jgi:NADH-ubiquinone oxidoreductase chain 2
MYFEKPSVWLIYEQMDREKSLVLGFTLFFMIFFFFYPSPLFLIAHKVALSISL